MNLACRREAEHHEPGPATKFGFQILDSCGSHKKGKAAYRQAKNLSTAFSTGPVASRDNLARGGKGFGTGPVETMLFQAASRA